MRAVVQRVTKASVEVDGREVGAIDLGLVILLGVSQEDTDKEVLVLANKIAGLRIFADDAGKMNLSLLEVGGAALVVSQFTLYGDVRKGRRPAFVRAARPELANALYESFCTQLRSQGVKVETGIFQAHMTVALVNDGPVTLTIDTEELSR